MEDRNVRSRVVSVSNAEGKADFKGVFLLIILRRVGMRKRVARRVSRLERGKIEQVE